MKKQLQLLIIFALMSMGLTYGICIQMKTVNNNGTTVNLTEQQSELKSEILKTSEKYDNLLDELDKLEKELEKVRANSTSSNSELAILEESIKEKNIALGLTEVTGSGIKIVLNDGNYTSLTANASDLLVHDGDIIYVLNELFNAGAEAISVNGQRIISTTAIECDGNVIKVNGTKMGAPFEITAIGYPEQLAGIGRPGGTIKYLESRGVIVTLNKQNLVTIPKYSGTIKFNYANSTENN